MTQVFTLKGIAIGEGRPKLIVPTTGEHASAVLASVEKLAAVKEIDVVELRLDYLDNGLDKLAAAALTRQVAELTPDKILLVTFRTQAEGGAAAISDAGYAELYLEILENGKADLLDLEMFRSEETVRKVVERAHERGVKVVMSSHDFERTPPKEEIVRRLCLQQTLGADILKIATMPHNAGDVLNLLAATWEVHSQHSDKPLLTMSMGGVGVVSRLIGELTGSALTFGMVGKASAPGQIAANDLYRVLDIIHQAGKGV